MIPPKIQTQGGDCNNNYNSDCKEELIIDKIPDRRQTMSG